MNEIKEKLKYKIDRFIDRGQIDMDDPTYFKGLIALITYYNELKDEEFRDKNS